MSKTYQQVLQESLTFGEFYLMTALKEANEKSVVFFDLENSVQFRGVAGGKEAFKQVERFRYIIFHWVKEYRGTIVKHTGDGMMAVFGQFIDALDCVRDTVLTVEAGGTTQAYPLRCKLGVAKGLVNEVRYSHGDAWTPVTQVSDYIGAPADLAARLAAIAYPGQILIDREIATSLKGGVGRYSPSRATTVNLKGFGLNEVSELLWEGRQAKDIDPQANALPVIKLPSLERVLDRAIDLLARADEDLHKLSILETDEDRKAWGSDYALFRAGDYALAYVDFPAFGSFSYPEKYERYRNILLEVAQTKKVRLAVLSPSIAPRSSKQQFPESVYADELQYNDRKKRFVDYVRSNAVPTYEQFISALLQKDAEFLGEVRGMGITVADQLADPRIHVWIRGTREAVISFVLISGENGEKTWSETGFYTTSQEFIQILRSYISTLIDLPLEGPFTPPH